MSVWGLKDPCFIPGQSLWDWWRKRCWDRVCLECFSFPPSVSFHQCSSLIHTSITNAGIWGKEIADELVRNGSVLGFLGPEPALGVCRQSIERRLSHWLINQDWARWWGLDGTQRQARELISGPNLAAKAKFLSLNRAQSRVITGLVTGHNTLRRHLHLLGLLDSPLCRRRGVKEETLAHILCECGALASLRHVYLGSFFLEPEDIKSISLGAIWNFGKVTGLPWFWYEAQRACFKKKWPMCVGTVRSQTQVQSNLI